MIRVAAIAAFVAVLAGCAGRPDTTQIQSTQTVTPADPLIGQTRWVRASWPVMLWDGPPASKSTILGTGTGRPLRSGEFTVLAANHTGLLPGYLIRFKDGRNGYVSRNDVMWSDDAKAHAAVVAAAAECQRKGPVRIGMTREQVYASCWGKPRSINVTRTAAGDHEQLVYSISSYVYLTNGKVSAIQGAR